MGNGVIWQSTIVIIFIITANFEKIFAKECTNTPTQISSHTIRAQLIGSNGDQSGAAYEEHYHLTPTDESAWMDLLPRNLLNRNLSKDQEFEWALLYRTLKGSASDGFTGDFLQEVSLHDVRIEPDSAHGKAQQTNLEYLLLLDVDRLVWSFRKQAGLPTPGTPYGGWETPNSELRGHFVGHYMSATAQMWASTHNDTLNQKMTSIVDVLYACQKQIGTGYLSAFPSEFFDRFEAIKPVWAPYYTIHKIMSGLVDQYTLANNGRALEMVVWMAEYFGNRVKNVIQKYTVERHWTSLNEETGGMNDVLYRLYTITGDEKHLTLAHLFDKPCFLGLLAIQADSLSGFHANTHIPIVIGAQKRYEVTGDALYKDIATFFMDIVNSSHSYATGGTSVSEFWSDPRHLADTLTTEDEESCTTYNMLKVSRNLFRWSRDMVYADHYERALTNGVLSIQRGTQPGVMIYMLPLGPGQSKARSYHKWGTQFDSFWCCYGTGIESFSKLGDSIYFEEKGSEPGLYIIQFISNSFAWKAGGIVINMKAEPVNSWDPFLHVSLTFSSTQVTSPTSTLKIRVPSWTSNGAKAMLNSQELQLPNPGTFLSLSRQWSSKDELLLLLPMSLRTEAIKDERPQYASLQAILFGPYLLAGLTNGDWDMKSTDTITAIPAAYNSQLVTITQESDNQTLFFSAVNNSFTMQQWPREGTDAALTTTFRILMQNSGKLQVLSRKLTNSTVQQVMLEPFHLPGMVVADQGINNNLGISSENGANSKFEIVQGLNGKANTVSFECSSHPGCFVYNNGRNVQLLCQESSSKDSSFADAASFSLRSGIRQYNPISFMAKGLRRNFLLEPLLSLKDETYTVYFNIHA